MPRCPIAFAAFVALATASTAAVAGGAPVEATRAKSTTPALDAKRVADIDAIFAQYASKNHIPGLVYGVVADGKLVYVHGAGVQDIDAKRPVTADTLFRIASMTKAFTALTILRLRDEGKLQLDAPAETYVPEMRDWQYATKDSPRIRVRDLLNHTAGFVTDDPWGDRQTPLPEPAFTKLLQDGVVFTSPTATQMEYSNLGYALLGRIITNVSGRPFAEEITATLIKPLGMDSTSFYVATAPADRRALGYRWEDGAWRLEPTMAHGAFGAMGGIQTSANDYAKWIAFLLSAWPPRDDADTGPVRRSTVRELAQGSNFPVLRQRPGQSGAAACRLAGNYGMGMNVAIDCELGHTLAHSGGYPGYGSHVLLLPDHGVGLFAFANRTYAGTSGAVWDAAMVLKHGDVLTDRTLPVSDHLASAYRAVIAIYQNGEVSTQADHLAMNFLMDHDAASWKRNLAALKSKLGDCDTSAPITATNALTGQFAWRCAKGELTGTVTLAPTQAPQIQELLLAPKSP